MNRTPNFNQFAQGIINARPKMVAIESKKFFREGFLKGGFTDTSFTKWADRKSPLGGKKTLIGNTQNLMSSIETLEATPDKVRTGSVSSYADMHNDGGTITVTEQSKKYWWAMYYRFAGRVTKTRRGKTSNSAGNRALNAKATYCKAMALMKVGSKIKIPKRQFIGESKVLMNQFEAWFKIQVEKSIPNT